MNDIHKLWATVNFNVCYGVGVTGNYWGHLTIKCIGHHNILIRPWSFKVIVIMRHLITPLMSLYWRFRDIILYLYFTKNMVVIE